jgi:glycopeptide antibiotics resistance protein
LAHPSSIGPGWALTLLAAYPAVVAAMRRHAEVSRRRLTAVSIFILYVVAVVAVTQFPIRPGLGEHHAGGDYWWSVLRWIPFVVPPLGFVLNIVMFVPFGILVPLLWPHVDSMRRLTGWALAGSGGIELTQFVLWVTIGSQRTVDINDLIANTAGGVLGLLLLRAAVPEPAERAELAT